MREILTEKLIVSAANISILKSSDSPKSIVNHSQMKSVLQLEESSKTFGKFSKDIERQATTSHSNKQGHT